MEKHYNKPQRLSTVFQTYQPPLWFITFCTIHRRPVLADDAVHRAFVEYALNGQSLGVGVGHYVMMPDHVHLFVRLPVERSLGTWIKGLKRRLAEGLRSQPETKHIWQPGFFDHLVRNGDSYAQKWAYVRDNPVRKGLATSWESWPYRGKVIAISGP